MSRRPWGATGSSSTPGPFSTSVMQPPASVLPRPVSRMMNRSPMRNGKAPGELYPHRAGLAGSDDRRNGSDARRREECSDVDRPGAAGAKRCSVRKHTDVGGHA